MPTTAERGTAGRHGRELVEEIRAAYEQQLRCHERSMAIFLESIARLCEEAEAPATPASLARAVRGAAQGEGRVSDNDVQLVLGTPAEPGMPQAGCQKDGNAKDLEEEAKIQKEFTVPALPFLDASGKIAHHESPMEHIIGPGLRRCQQQIACQVACVQPMNGRFADFVDGHVFKVMSVLVIMLNYYFIIVQTDYKMSHLNQDEPRAMFLVEVCFTAFYVWELSCQILAYRKEFFCGKDLVWNIFDLIIVLVSVFELVMTLMGGSAMNLSFLRVLRFLKISRVLRMFSALRLMKEIRIMVDALAGSFLIFVFCSIMLMMFFSIFAIFFVQGMTTHLEDNEVHPEMLQAMRSDFGSVSRAILSLFMSVTGGNDWAQYHNTVKVIGARYDFLYLFFIGFSSIAFVNVITGVFAEKAMSLAVPTTDELSARRTEKEMRDARELMALLHRVSDTDERKQPQPNRVSMLDGTKVISSESFDALIDHPEVAKFLEVRGLKQTSARRFFKLLLEIHQTSTIDFGTFVSACVKLDGTASSIDLHVLGAEIKSMQLKQCNLTKFLKEHLHALTFRSSRKPETASPSSGRLKAGDWKPQPISLDQNQSGMPSGDEVPLGVQAIDEYANSSSDHSQASTMPGSKESTESSSNAAKAADCLDCHICDPSVPKPQASPSAKSSV